MREFRKWSAALYLNLGSYLDRKLARFAINNSQYFYILKICEVPGMSQDRVFQIIRRSPSNITRALAQLEEKGYITRQPSERDKRTWLLYPTEKATAAYPEILAIVEDAVVQILTPFTEEERALLPALLERAARSAEALNRKEQKNDENKETL